MKWNEHSNKLNKFLQDQNALCHWMMIIDDHFCWSNVPMFCLHFPQKTWDQISWNCSVSSIAFKNNMNFNHQKHIKQTWQKPLLTTNHMKPNGFCFSVCPCIKHRACWLLYQKITHLSENMATQTGPRFKLWFQHCNKLCWVVSSGVRWNPWTPASHACWLLLEFEKFQPKSQNQQIQFGMCLWCAHVFQSNYQTREL